MNTTFTFAYPALLIFPFLIALLALRRKAPIQACPYPSVELLRDLPPSWRVRLRTWLLPPLFAAFVICLSLAAARPQRVHVLTQEQAAHDLILALDISGSMREADFRIGGRYANRLQAVKHVVSQFIEQRSADRIGVVVFGSNALVQAPLTRDHSIVRKLIDMLEVGIAGDGTAIGDGIGTSLKRLEEIEGNSKAVILLTDGANNSGHVDPIEAAKIAQRLHIKVHTIGIGRRQARGGPGAAEYDEATLRKIAELTGGYFFNAQDLEGLKLVYSEIDELERRAAQDAARQQVEELFTPLTWMALSALALYLILTNTLLMKVP